MIVHEGIRMTYTSPEWVYALTPVNKSGCVIEETERVYAGDGMEPSGHVFPNFFNASKFTFHPYDGSAPVPCGRPRGYVTHQK